MEDDVGRNARLARQPAAFGAQRLEQRINGAIAGCAAAAALADRRDRDRQRLAARQNAARARAETESTISVGAQCIARDQRPRGGRDQRHFLGRANPEHRQFVVTEIAHFLTVVAAQHSAQMADAKAHFSAEGGGQ